MTSEERAARERKQKIFVVVGGILLLGLLAIQLPRLMGGSGETAAATTPAQETVVPGESTTPTPVVLVDAGGGAGTASAGKLTAFSAFEKKNPFVQLVVTGDGVTGDAAPPDGGGKGGEKQGTNGSSKDFSTGSKGAAPAVTIVSVNGSRQTIQPGATFPESDPVFVLVSEQPGSKSVVVGVVGGAYAGGSKTTKLKVGKPLTLVNTATGAKYKITLVSVGSGEAVEKPTEKPAASR